MLPAADKPRRFPAPWTLVANQESFAVQDGTGFTVAYVYFEVSPVVGTGPLRLTRDEARRIAVNIARLPELLLGVRGRS